MLGSSSTTTMVVSVTAPFLPAGGAESAASIGGAVRSASVTHYERLGVPTDANVVEIRRAYLARARSSHPDLNADERATVEMVALNEAWTVLSDESSRARYDASIGVGSVSSGASGIGGAGGARTPLVQRPDDRPFVAYHALDEDDDDEWRYTDDVGDPRTAPGRFTVFAPVALLMAASLVGVFGLASGHDLLVVLAVVLGAFGCVGLFVVPMIAMGRATRYERNDPPGAR